MPHARKLTAATRPVYRDISQRSNSRRRTAASGHSRRFCNQRDESAFLRTPTCCTSSKGAG
jgi:hypothetical protein